MINKNLTSWTYDDATMRNLALFANFMDEMAFNYTTDSFKASALNVVSLIEETYTVVTEVQEGLMKEGTLDPLIKELHMALNHDKLFAKVLEDKNLTYLLQELKDVKHTSAFSRALHIIIIQNLAIPYYEEVKKAIVDLVKTNSKQRKILYDRCRDLYTGLKIIGFSDDYIYFANRDFFYSNKKISDANQIEQYFNLFDKGLQQYVVYLIANPIFKNLKDVLAEKGVDVIEELALDDKDKKVSKFKHAKSGNNIFLKLTVDAYDAYKARELALTSISETARLFMFFNHKSNMKLHPYSLVVNINDLSLDIIKPSLKYMVRCKDNRVPKANDKFKEAYSKMSFTPESKRRIMNSLELHKAALESDNINNQLANLFTSLEVMIPKDADSGNDRIVQIRNVLVPYLCIGYYPKLVESVLSSLFVWNKTFTSKVLDKVAEGDNYQEKMVSLIVLAKYYDNTKATELPYNELKNKLFGDKYFSMLIRLDYMHSILHSFENLYETLKLHEKRVAWHIDRIYRTRNRTVHAGSTPVYMGTLIENVHSYYDVLINQLLIDNINHHFEDVKIAYHYCQLKKIAYQKFLQENKGKDIDEKNIIKAVFFK